MTTNVKVENKHCVKVFFDDRSIAYVCKDEAQRKDTFEKASKAKRNFLFEANELNQYPYHVNMDQVWFMTEGFMEFYEQKPAIAAPEIVADAIEEGNI